MRLFSIFCLSILTLASPSFAADRSYPVGAFDRIELAGSAVVDVREGSAHSLVATGADADLDRLDISVRDARLVIGMRKNQPRMRSGPVKIAVIVPSLQAATLSGSGDISVDRARGPFDALVSGSGALRLASLDAPMLSLRISGSGDIFAAGQCGDGRFAVTGNGTIRAADLQCRTLDARISGSGNVQARATDTADVRVTGSGNVTISGGARCTTRTTGSGTIRCG